MGLTLKENFSLSLISLSIPGKVVSWLVEVCFSYDCCAVFEHSLKMALIKSEINKLTEQYLCALEREDEAPIMRFPGFYLERIRSLLCPPTLIKLSSAGTSKLRSPPVLLVRVPH